MPFESITYRRRDLYEEVWKEPLLTVAARYGVSDVALAKVCRKLAIPLPGRGYWARAAAGQDVERQPLRRLPEGGAEEFRGRRWKAPSDSSELQERIAKETEPDAKIVVPDALTDPHELVAMSARVLASRSRGPWRRCLHIEVSAGLVDRALRIMDALLKALEARGLKVEVTPIPPADKDGIRPRTGVEPNDTRVLVGDDWVRFGLKELRVTREIAVPESERERRRLQLSGQKYESVGTGRLALELLLDGYETGRRRWADGKHRRVEHCLNEFVAQIYVRAEVLRTKREEQERWRRDSAEREKRRLEAEDRARDEARKTKELRDHVAAWRLARDIREYVAELQGICASVGRRVNPDGPFGEVLAWAEEYVERIDPLSRVRQEAARVKAEDEASTEGKSVAPASSDEGARAGSDCAPPAT